ncbi:MAG: ATP-binding protein [Niabella sp.]
MRENIRIVIAFFLSVIILIVLGVYANYQAKVYERASDATDRSQKIIGEAQEILNSIQEVETAYRGFTITNDSVFLSPLFVGEKMLKISFAKLSQYQLTPAQKKLADSIQKHVKDKVSLAYDVIVKRKHDSFEAAQNMIKTTEDNKLMTVIRYHISKFINNERQILQQKAANEEHQLSKLVLIITLAVITSIIVILLTLIYVLRIYKRLVSTERRLLTSQMRLESILDMLPIGIMIINAPLKQYRANNKAREILGGDIRNEGPLSDLTGKRPNALKSSLPDELLLTQALNGEETIGINDITIVRNNKEIPLRISAIPLYNEKGEIEYAISAFDDITNIKKFEQELIQANKIVEETLRLKDTFLANMSHEIRTPMNAILGFTELLSTKDLGAIENEYINTIHTSGESLLRLLNDILDFSKLEANMMTFEQHPISIQGALSSIHMLYTPKARSKDIQLILNVDPAIPEYLVGDPMRLTQIITNILGNAIKFTEKGSILIYAQKLSEDEEKALIEFKIKDSGIGIPKEKVESIFSRFEQGGASMARQYGGTGIGLSIVKQLVELQHGKIDVVSEVGLGTVFTIQLPFANYHEGDFNIPDHKKDNIDINMLKQLSILLVEDNVVNAKLADSIFREHDIHITIAENGKIAIQKLNEQSFDIILMDIEMPEMNGYDTTRYIRQEMKSTIPIIAMTAHALAGEREKCQQAGMNDYLAKPINTHELFLKIYTIIEKYKKRKSNQPAENHILETEKSQTQEHNDVDVTPNHHHNSVNKQTIQLDYLHSVSANNKQFEKEIMEMLQEQLPQQVGDLENAYADGNLSTLKGVSHKLKSSISILGVNSIYRQLEQIEIECGTGLLSTTTSNGFPQLASDLKELMEELDHLLNTAFVH